MRNTIYLMLLMVFIFSCKKDTVLENIIIEDNTAPPYNEVTTVQIQNYVNKIYIDLLGREPLESELNSSASELKSNSLSDASREQLLTNLMESEEYYKRFYEIYQTSYLPGVTNGELDLTILIYEVERDQAIQNGNNTLVQLYNLELDLMYALRNARVDYQNGEITINEFMSRITRNQFYEEINMGAENYVLSCFENFLKRTPTDAQLIASVNMVEGNPAQVFFQDGNNQNDFINILMNTAEFYQGLSIDIYNQLLVRLPDSQEMVDTIFIFDETQDYQSVQRLVMKSDEYAGF
ncbi:MAG: DUF4214 domain-containing protein [Saprospiraceae bacterium]